LPPQEQQRQLGADRPLDCARSAGTQAGSDETVVRQGRHVGAEGDDRDIAGGGNAGAGNAGAGNAGAGNADGDAARGQDWPAALDGRCPFPPPLRTTRSCTCSAWSRKSITSAAVTAWPRSSRDWPAPATSSSCAPGLVHG